MGRIAADATSEGTWIYVAGREHLFRYRWDSQRLDLDRGWHLWPSVGPILSFTPLLRPPNGI